VSDDLRVLGISGSLRKGSFNGATLRAAQELAPAGMTIDSYDISAIPLYNGDVEAAGLPAPVVDLRARIATADALLFVTPEYNFSVPGVLKNAIDWASRPPQPPFSGKPAAVMGAAGGILGTGRSQYHLRQVLNGLNCLLVNRPEVFIGSAASKFDANLTLTDAPARDLIAALLQALQDWTLRLRTAG
jgi:chromate reductase